MERQPLMCPLKPEVHGERSLSGSLARGSLELRGWVYPDHALDG
jgi:hypothetical protein